MRITFVLLCGMTIHATLLAGPAQPAAKPATVELLEDNGAELLKHFTNPGGEGGIGSVDAGIVFSGKSSVKIVPLQRYHNAVPGWKHRITEKPKPGEYRYVRFAWKGTGCAGIMVQFAHDATWGHRYVAGQNMYGWAAKSVGPTAPAEWTMVTQDMFKDFGEHTITGLALTVFGNQPGYFDHIYLGLTIDDLDRIDVTGLRTGKPVTLTANDLDRLWKDLAGADASRAYLAFWTLVADAKNSVPFLAQRLAGPKADLTQIKKWIAELDDAKYIVREMASKQLAQNLDRAVDLLEQELAKGSSAEATLRIQALLALGKNDAEVERLVKAVRVLEYTASAAAIKSLTDLSKEADKAQVRKAASAALDRLKVSAPK